MNLSDDQRIEKKLEKKVDIAIERLYFHTNMNLLVFRGDSTQLKENVNSLNYNERKIIILIDKNMQNRNFFICVDVYKDFEGYDYDKLYEVLSTLKKGKLKINDILIEKYKDMLKKPDFEQKYWSRPAEGIS